MVWDSQCTVTTAASRIAASAAVSRANRLLPIPGGPTMLTTHPAPPIASSTSAVSHFPRTPNQSRLVALTRLMFLDGQEPPRRNGSARTLDRMQFGLAEQHRVLDQTSRRLTEHDPAGRRYRFHPLRHTDLFADGGVTGVPRTDFAGDDLARVEPDAQLQSDTVAAHHIGRERDRLIVNLQRRDAGTNRVILQRRRRPEDRHDPVAGELVDGASVALHHGRRTVEQLGHDLAQPLGTHCRRDVHRMDHIGEQDGHLLVLGGPA